MATFTTIAGSLFGSCTCFLLGRYILRSRIRIWGRKKYPFFDAMDGAISENGFKIMCLLYLTPILPLGPVSYMVGTTSMSIGKFAGAKVAAVPIVIMYCFIGASTDTFFGNGDVVAVENDSLGMPRMMDEAGGGSIDGVSGEGGIISSGGREGGIGVSKPIVNGMVGGGSGAAAAAVGGGVVDESTHRKMVLFGLILSFVSISLVSHFVKKELYKIFDKQKRDKSDDGDEDGDGRGGIISSSSATTVNNNSNNAMEDHIEMGSGVDRKNLQRRPRGGGVGGHHEGSGGIDSRIRHDEEKG